MSYKKVLALLLAFTMCLGMIPAVAFADGDIEIEPVEEVKAVELEEGIVVVKPADEIQTATDVARFNGQNYATLSDAYKAVLDAGGGEIMLLKDAAGKGIGCDGDAAVTYTIDFQGHTYTCTGPAVGSKGTETQAFRVINGQKVTMKNGTFTCTNDAGVYMLFHIYDDLVLDNMTIDGSQMPGSGSGLYTLSYCLGNSVIKGNTVIKVVNDGTAFDVDGNYAKNNNGTVSVTFANDFTGEVNGIVEYNYKEAGRSTLTINGNGDFTNATFTDNSGDATPAFTISGGTFATDPSAYVVEGKEVVKSGANFVVVEAGSAVAEINDVKFASLDDALKAAENGETVKVLKNCVAGEIDTGKSVILNLNGKTVSGNLWIIGNSTLTIEGETEGSKIAGCVCVGYSNNDNGNVIIHGGTYDCGPDNTCLHINGTCHNSNVTIENATFISENDNAIQLNGSGVFVLKNSSFTGATGVYIKSGNTTITNCTIIGNKTPVDYSYNGNGSNATGDGIVIDACNYPGGDPTVLIQGNTVVTGSKAAVGCYSYNGGKYFVTITGGTFTNGASEPVDGQNPNYNYSIVDKVPNGYEVDDDLTGANKTIKVSAHAHEYNIPNWSWSWSGSTYNATLRLSCECGDSKSYKATVTSTDGETAVTYTATATVEGTEYSATKVVNKAYTVTMANGSENFTINPTGLTHFPYGRNITLTAEKKCDWTINGIEIAKKTEKISFAITKDVEVCATESAIGEIKPEDMFYASMKYTGNNGMKNVFLFEAGWNLPEGYSIQSAFFYRLGATESKTLTAQQMMTEGKKASINLRMQFASYDATITTSNTYFYGLLVVTYKDASGAVQTYYSPVVYDYAH